MKDNVGIKEEITFILNGKPIKPEPQLICPRCGTDRLKQPCPNLHQPLECPMTGKAC